MRSEPYCCACGVESCRCGAGGKVAEMDNEQVRVCRCCGEAETHRDGCREMMAADPLHGPRRVWDRQKAEMSAGEAVRVRSIFGLYGEKVDRTVLSSAGHASKQAMLDDDRVNMARNDLIDRMTAAKWSTSRPARGTRSSRGGATKVRAEYEERARRFIEYARKRFAEEMYNHGASTGKPLWTGSIMALEALLPVNQWSYEYMSRSPDGLTGGGSR
jgi:hypothetical protein